MDDPNPKAGPSGESETTSKKKRRPNTKVLWALIYVCSFKNASVCIGVTNFFFLTAKVSSWPGISRLKTHA